MKGSRPLIELTASGLYCPQGDFYIDPTRGVEQAIITHAHSDHARRGSAHYFAEQSGIPLLHERIGKSAPITGLRYGETIQLGNTRVSLHPAGHILGSSQVRVESEGKVWVITGDYKRDIDPTCPPFEVIPCDVLITESTFGLPIYRWKPVSEVALEMIDWWRTLKATGRNCVLFGYSLGKAQRVLAEMRPHLTPEEKILIHDSMEPLNQVYKNAGVSLAPTYTFSDIPSNTPLRGVFAILPPGAASNPILRRLAPYETGFASGWMKVNRKKEMRRFDRSFVMSDHADWPSLIQTVKETGAKKVYVMHGDNEILARYLTENQFEAHPISALSTTAPARGRA
jgi:putative mRNA 3-end processing factor